MMQIIFRSNQTELNPPRKVAFIVLFTALSVVTNYLMFPLWNTKLMDCFVFISGYYLGFTGGALVASLVWLVYGTMNPLGFSLFILLITIPAEMIYGIMGAIIGRRRLNNKLNKYCVGFDLTLGVIGLTSTLFYDILTNALSGITFTNTLWPGVLVGLATMNFPLPFGIIHQTSNFLFFALLIPLIISRIDRFFLNYNSTSIERI